MKTLCILATTFLALTGSPALSQQYDTGALAMQEQGSAFSPAELDQLLAPIALYPDALLSQVLIASTYPLEIVEAARWLRSNPSVEGEQAVEAVADMDWDASIKGLVAFPDVLSKMDEDLDWTRRLGDAFLYQEAEVMDRVQFLRDRAYQAGNLESTEYARVIREERVITIEPVRQHMVHVPYYDPWVAYGPWWRPAYSPTYWAPPPFYHYGHAGLYWSHGIGLSPGFFYSTLHWPRRHIVILHAPRYCHTYYRRPHRGYYTAGQHWNHNPIHRRGVNYRHADVRQRFGHSSASGLVPVTARRVVTQPRPRDGAEPANSLPDRVRTSLARDAEPRTISPGPRTQQPVNHERPQPPVAYRPAPAPQARSALQPAPRAVSDSGNREGPTARSRNRQPDTGSGDRTQSDAGPRMVRGPNATLTRPN